MINHNSINTDEFKREIFNNKSLDLSKAYQQNCRPKLAELLESLKLNKSYHKANGDYLYYYKRGNDQSIEVPVIDFVGGYGVNFLGHHHPELTETMIRCLQEQLPFSAQCATRTYAALLADRLNHFIPGSGRYYSNITNSGTEAVEAAIKHAYMVWCDNVDRKASQLMCSINDFFNDCQGLGGVATDDQQDIEKIKDSILAYNVAQLSNYSKDGVIYALKGSFHGKTTASVKVTYNQTFRGVFENMTTFKTCFIDPDALHEFEHEYQKHFFSLKYPQYHEGKIVVNETFFSKSIAFIFEVVMGEGGVIILPDDKLSKIGEFHSKYKVPLIIDEVQTGCGRTGSFFAFANTPLKNLEPEYITLSKALGGGIVKIGVTLINENVYDPEFGLLHTSTFAEDDHSCRLALKTLEIISRDDNQLLKTALDKGNYILRKLNDLKTKYPGIIKDVRGKGLMIGLEFTEMDSYNPFFKYAGKQGFISMLVSGYILEHHNIRLLSPLSTMFKHKTGHKRKSVIRIQPSVYIRDQEIDRLMQALDETFRIIDHNNEFVLLAHLFNQSLTDEERKNPVRVDAFIPANRYVKKVDRKLGFLVHITELDYLINHYLRSFKHYSFRRMSLIKWWNGLCRFLEPDLMHTEYLNIQNKTIEANIICLPYLPKYMIKTYAEGKDQKNPNRMNELRLLEMQDKIQEAGCYSQFVGTEKIPVSIVGFGAYNSIITENATSVNDVTIPVTTGNAYTTALLYQGILKAVEHKRMALSTCSMAVVGAAGNIGKSISELFCDKVKRLVLIGREGQNSQEKLAGIQEICCQKFEDTKKRVRNYSEEVQNQSVHTLNVMIQTGTIHDLVDVDIVVVATNSSDINLVTPDNVKPGAIVCCASVPSNLSEKFKEGKYELLAFDSGYAKLPDHNVVDLIGMPKDGMVFGCLGETIILAMEDDIKSYKGAINSTRIDKIIELADKNGFEPGRFALGDHIKKE